MAQVSNWFKKIRHGLNLVGNKIINAKVETPTDSEHIANKDYVDTINKYDTVLATTKTVSTKFDWVNNVGNLSIKDVMDKILFPISYPTYFNPDLNNYEFTSNEPVNFHNSIIEGKLKFDFNLGDRTPTTNFKLIVKRLNEPELFFESIDSSTQEIDFNFLWQNIEYIKLFQIFSPVTVKNDSDGNPYIDNSFNTTFNFEVSFDVLKIEKELGFKKQILFKLGDTENDVLLNLNKTETELKQEFTLGNTINLISQLNTNTNKLNSCSLLIHESQINSVDANIQFKSTTKNLGITEFYPNKYVLKNQNNEKEFVSFSDGKYYLCFVENFGKFNENINVTINL